MSSSDNRAIQQIKSILLNVFQKTADLCMSMITKQLSEIEQDAVQEQCEIINYSFTQTFLRMTLTVCMM